MPDAQCDIIIPVYNKPELTKNCLESIRAKTTTPYRLILVDNGSSGDIKGFLEDFKRSDDNVILVRNEENLGWVKAVNQGIKLSSAPYVCVMNNDTVVHTKGWLSQLIAVAAIEPDIGLVNPRFEVKIKQRSDKPYIEVDFCRGYCILIKRAVLEKIGGLDEGYGLGYYDDDDFSVRALRARFKCVRANDVYVEHMRDSTFKDLFAEGERLELHEKNKALFYKKWGRRLNVAFVMTKARDRHFFDILLSLARRQHIVYVWNGAARAGLEHINIRYKKWPGLVTAVIAPFFLGLNWTKQRTKRYAAVFTDDAVLCQVLSKVRPKVYYFNADKDESRVVDIIDAIAKTDQS